MKTLQFSHAVINSWKIDVKSAKHHFQHRLFILFAGVWEKSIGLGRNFAGVLKILPSSILKGEIAAPAA